MAITTLIGDAIKLRSHALNIRSEMIKGNKSKYVTWQSSILPLRYHSKILHFSGNAVGKQYCYDLEMGQFLSFFTKPP